MTIPASLQIQNLQPMTKANAHTYRTRTRHPHSALSVSNQPNRPRSTPATPVQPTSQRKIRPAATPTVAPPTHPSATAGPPPPPQTCLNSPVFPPPDVSLHKEDAANKVFLAIGRSFLSVDNRAMTIKDLSEMTMKYGLMCQNVSAAGQAITTFIRNHMQRCEEEQDQPLLSRHVLSGTPSDDELVPALHSRSGGAHCALASEANRITNFRRGTMVWYLSRAAGAPCPFTRAGICLAEYTEDGKQGCPGAGGPRERKRERDRRRRMLATQQQLCGQKRKRLARGCKPDSKIGSDDELDENAAPVYEDEGAAEGEADIRPPKVKLMLRLRPSLSASSASASPAPVPSPSPDPTMEAPSDMDEVSESESDADSSSDSDSSMSVDSDEDEDSVISPSPMPSFTSPPPSAFFRMPSPSSFASHHHHFPRSTSVASLPPDSEDDDDMYDHSRFDYDDDDDDDDMDWSSDESEDGEVKDETAVVVKQEPIDEDSIGGLLQAWDSRDRGAESRRVLEVVAAAASLSTPSLNAPPPHSPSSPIVIKREEIDTWDLSGPAHEVEDDASALLSPSEDIVFSPVHERELRWPGFSPDCVSVDSQPVERARRPSELLWQDTEILGLETIESAELDEGDWVARQPSPPPMSLPAAAPSPEAESEEDALGPCTPSSSLPSIHLPRVWTSSSPFSFGNRHIGPVAETPEKPTTLHGATERRSAADEHVDGNDAHAFAPFDHEHEGTDAGSLWDMDELRRCIPGVPPPALEHDEPLSPTEEEMFAVLCDVRDFEAPRSDGPSAEAAKAAAEKELEEVERPLALRRSRRVQQQSQRKGPTSVNPATVRRKRGVR